MQKVSYVIPCYRSAHTLADVVAEITATMQSMPQYDYEIVLVNDCSPDDTIGTIRRLVAADAHVQGGRPGPEFWAACGTDGRIPPVHRRCCGLPG